MSDASIVTNFIIEEFLPDISADQLNAEFDLIANGVIDSLGLLKVIAWIENRFQFSVDAMEMTPENFSSIAAICSFLERARQTEVA